LEDADKVTHLDELGVFHPLVIGEQALVRFVRKFRNAGLGGGVEAEVD
jgi:hypothetical protein